MDSPFGNAGDADIFLARAELLFDLDRFDDAREELHGALTADPAHVRALTLLAILELQVDNHDAALTAASAALAAEPTHDAAQLARGHALALLRRANEALDVAEEIQNRHPESWWHNVHYALIVRESRNGQDALDAAWVAVRLAPEDARTHLALARVAVDLGLSDLAERALATAERLDPGAATDIRRNLGPRLLRGSPNSSRRSYSPHSDGLGGLGGIDPQDERTPLPNAVRGALRVAGFIGVLIPVVTVCATGLEENAARIVAGLGAAAGLIGLLILFNKLSPRLQDELREMARTDRVLAAGVALAAGGPVLSGLYAALGEMFLLPVGMLAASGALIIAALHRR